MHQSVAICLSTKLTVEHWRAQRDKADMLTSTLKGFIYQKGNEARNVQ